MTKTDLLSLPLPLPLALPLWSLSMALALLNFFLFSTSEPYESASLKYEGKEDFRNDLYASL